MHMYSAGSQCPAGTKRTIILPYYSNSCHREGHPSDMRIDSLENDRIGDDGDSVEDHIIKDQRMEGKVRMEVESLSSLANRASSVDVRSCV